MGRTDVQHAHAGGPQLAPGDACDRARGRLARRVGATALALVVSWPAARAIGERRLRRPGPLLILLALPLLVPPYATGQGLTEWFIRFGLADSLTGLTVAHLVPVLPLRRADPRRRLRPAGERPGGGRRLLGAGPVRRFYLVTVPAVPPMAAAAALMGLLVSWSQYGLSLAVGGGLPMLPIVLLPFVSGDPQVGAALSILFLAPAIRGPGRGRLGLGARERGRGPAGRARGGAPGGVGAAAAVICRARG